MQKIYNNSLYEYLSKKKKLKKGLIFSEFVNDIISGKKMPMLRLSKRTAINIKKNKIINFILNSETIERK